jgi:stage IV sporulation protein B
VYLLKKIAIFHKKILVLGFVIGLAIFFTGSCVLQIYNLPQILRLSPGQKITLSAYFPLSFYAIHHHLGAHFPVTAANNLVLNSQNNEKFDIQVRILGTIAIKKLHVEIAQPPTVVPGGQAIGVLVSSKGVVIVGDLSIKGVDQHLYYPAKEAGIKIGDILLAINNSPINRVDEVELQLRNFQPQRKYLKLKILRHNKILILNIKPVLSSSTGVEQHYMLGIYIEDPAAGVGTLTFYDPHSNRFAGLGHRIAEFAGKPGIPFEQGEIVLAKISGLRVGIPGQPGEKIGVFNSLDNPLGKIEKNSRFGIYGRLYGEVHSIDTPIPAAYGSQIKVGPAQIYTVLHGTKIEHFNVVITKVYRQDAPRDKGMVLKVVDPLLLRLTGGIIQGMSGSPIVQDGKFVGAVTHVLVNDPTKGYGVLAEWMIREMNKAAS